MLTFLCVLLSASAVDISSAWVLNHLDLSRTARLSVALAPLPGNLILIALVLGAIRKLDEFQKRLHFEAVVVAFLATGVIVFIYGFLQKAGAVSPLNTWFIWLFMAITYAVGYGIAVRHYQ
jgi:hypothetical protein